MHQANVFFKELTKILVIFYISHTYLHLISNI